MGATYDGDVIADVGKAERRDLASRMAVLIMHLLKWQMQPERRGASWERTMREQRRRIGRALEQMPSLRPMLGDPEWAQDIWADGTAEAARETGLELAAFPETCPRAMGEVIRNGWVPA